MTATANRNISLSKGSRILKGQTVTIFRAISPVTEKLYEVIVSETESFFTPESHINKFFTIK